MSGVLFAVIVGVGALVTGCGSDSDAQSEQHVLPTLGAGSNGSGGAKTDGAGNTRSAGSETPVGGANTGDQDGQSATGAGTGGPAGTAGGGGAGSDPAMGGSGAGTEDGSAMAAEGTEGSDGEGTDGGGSADSDPAMDGSGAGTEDGSEMADEVTEDTDTPELEPFSFFVTSMEAMQRMSGNMDGFGGDLRYGEADGLAGADKICNEIAEASMPGSTAKEWRAFLSVTDAAPGGAVDAIDRIGDGPWYDRLGRVVAMDKAALVEDNRPEGADPIIINDLPNEFGLPNHAPDGMTEVDNHHTMTGSGTDGRLYQDDPRVTCQDWTSAVGSDGQPRTGFSWPRGGTGGSAGRGFGGGPGGGSSSNWISGYSPPGCAAHANIVQTGPPPPGTVGVGSGGGYGGIYCFALSP